MRDSIQIALAGILLFSTCLICDQWVTSQTYAAEPETKTTSTATAKTESEDSKKTAKKVRLAHIAIKGSLPESPGQMSLFGDLQTDLRKTIARLDKAAKDDKISGVVLEIKNPVSWGKLNELTHAVRRVQASGKKVYAHIESAMGSQYVLASACDEIIMPEGGIVFVPGVRAEFGFFKDLLDKLGIEADFIHMGESKGAAEPFTRSDLSEPVRENRTAMIDDLYDQLITQIATNRSMKVDEVKQVIDQGLLTARDAKEKGLIDEITYPDQLRTRLTKDYEADKLVYVMNYAKKKVDTDFSGPMGFMKLFNLMLGDREKKADKSDKIAIVYAVGAIIPGKSQEDPFMGSIMGSDTIVKALRDAAEDENVKAIVLRVNSPGGSALASDLIWRATQTVEKPIVASMGDIAASGGYYISMGADKIIAEPGTITGSIGVVGGKFNMSGMYDKIGLSTEIINRGKNSGIMSSMDKYSEEERKVVYSMMEEIYVQFTSKAAEGRNMEPEKLLDLAGGKIYTGRDAKRVGLVDELGTLEDAIRDAKQLAGLASDSEVELRVLPKPENPFEALFGIEKDAEKEVGIAARGLARLVPELARPIQQALQLKAVMREPVGAYMPYWVEIR